MGADPHRRRWLDMIHDEPGQTPYATRYREPAHLAALGADGVVTWRLQELATWSAIGPLPADTIAAITAEQDRVRTRLADIAAAGLEPWLCGDLFVLPKAILDADPAAYAPGRRPIIDSLHPHRPAATLCPGREPLWTATEAALDEVLLAFPEAPGIVIRIGEQYTHDAPWLVGADPLACRCSQCSHLDGSARRQRILQTLEALAIRHDRLVLLRTWDLEEAGWHADPALQADILTAWQGDPRLMVASKHGHTDHWRYQPWNPAIALPGPGRVVELQCQREYEFKGLLPDWLGQIWQTGQPEVDPPGTAGLRDGAPPDWRGLLTWTRGGGWGGPQPPSELWVDLNVVTAAALHADPAVDLGSVLEGWLAAQGLADAEGRMAALVGRSADLVFALRYLPSHRALVQQSWVPNELWYRDARFMAGRLALVIAAHLEAGESACAALVADREAAVALAEGQLAEAEALCGEGGPLATAPEADFVVESYRFAVAFAHWTRTLFSRLIEGRVRSRSGVKRVLEALWREQPLPPLEDPATLD